MKTLLRRLFRLPSSVLRPPSSGWSVPYDVKPLKQRLAALAVDDPLHPLLAGYIHHAIVAGAGTLVGPDEGSAQRFVGRQNQLDDLARDWNKL